MYRVEVGGGQPKVTRVSRRPRAEPGVGARAAATVHVTDVGVRREDEDDDDDDAADDTVHVERPKERLKA